MKLIQAFLITCFAFNTAFADTPVESLMLHSTQKNNGAVWTSNGSFYFKSFDVVVLNMGHEDINLSKVCYQTFDAKGASYQVDAVDESLVVGMLKPGISAKGFYQSSGLDEGVYNAFMIKATYCNK